MRLVLGMVLGCVAFAAEALPIRLEIDGFLTAAGPDLAVGDPVGGYIEFDPDATSREGPTSFFGGLNYQINVLDHVVTNDSGVHIAASQVPGGAAHLALSGADAVLIDLYGFTQAIQWGLDGSALGLDFSRLVFGRFDVVQGLPLAGEFMLRPVKDVPEPGTLALLAAGVALLGVGRRRRLAAKR